MSVDCQINWETPSMVTKYSCKNKFLNFFYLNVLLFADISVISRDVEFSVCIFSTPKHKKYCI